MSISVNGYDATAVSSASGAPVAGRIFAGTATTNGNGQWSITVPAGIFASAPIVHATPVSADNTAPNGAYASVVSPTQSSGAWTFGGLVLLPATIQALGGLPAKAAGAGTVVMVIAMGS